jgi:hypothetical protein
MGEMDAEAPGQRHQRLRAPRLNPRNAYRLFWFDHSFAFGCVGLSILLAVLLAPTGKSPPPAVFLPLIPGGVALLINGLLLWTNHQGVRDRLAQNPLVRLTTVGGLPGVGSRFGAVIVLIMGSGFLAWGLITAIVLVSRAF